MQYIVSFHISHLIIFIINLKIMTPLFKKLKIYHVTTDMLNHRLRNIHLWGNIGKYTFKHIGKYFTISRNVLKLLPNPY